MWYMVQPGDTLSLICYRFGVSIPEMMRSNMLINGFLYIGQRLFIPEFLREFATYVVEGGDTLESIARKFNITKEDIMKLNNLSNETVFPGQSLNLQLRSEETSLSSPGNIVTYTVKIGDTLTHIAHEFHTSREEIMKLNNLASEAIVNGQQLLIEVQQRQSSRPMGINLRRPEGKDIKPYKSEFTMVYDSGLRSFVKVWKIPGKEDVFFFASKLAVTAGGAPNAYNKDNEKALDFLSNAGEPGNWWGLVTDAHGNPKEIKGSDGFFISRTALGDCSKPLDDPKRYVDATAVPYIVLPAHNMMGAGIGDLAVVINTKNNKMSSAIVADTGPDDSLGIGSMALAKAIGIDPNPKSGGVVDNILYIVFTKTPGASSCIPKTPEQMNTQAQWLFSQWGGIEQAKAAFKKFPISYAD